MLNTRDVNQKDDIGTNYERRKFIIKYYFMKNKLDAYFLNNLI